MGRNALGRLSIVDEFISPTYDFAVGECDVPVLR